MEIKNARILITGCSKRIGRAMALGLADRGAHILAHYRTPSPDQESLAVALGERGSFYRADFNQLDQVETMADQLATDGGVDVIINNSSIFYSTPCLEKSRAALDEFMRVHVSAPLILAEKLVPGMEAKGRGKIVNIGDIYDRLPRKGYLSYCISKAGLWMMTQNLAADLAPTIQVNTVSPGAILMAEGHTSEQYTKQLERVPLKRSGDPEDILRAVVYCLESDYVTGQNLVVDGGRSFNIL